MLYRLGPPRIILTNPLIWLFVAFASYCQVCYSNGWEHTSIDFDVLVQALNDSNPNVRRHAAESLGFRRQPVATEALLERLKKNEPVAGVRQEVFNSLGKIGEESALGAIQNCLLNETNVAVRVQCASSLGNFNSEVAEQLAIKRVLDENIQVRLQAVASLGSFSSASTVQTLTELTKDNNVSISSAALLALGRTRSPAATPVLVESLRQATSRQAVLVLLKALTFLANPDAVEIIQTVYEQSDDEEVKRYALVAMANTRAKGSESYFLESLSSEDTASRILGLAVLRNFGSRNEVPAIVEHALNDSIDLFSQGSDLLLREPVQTISKLELLNEYLRTIILLAPETGERLFVMASAPKSIPRTSTVALKVAQGFYNARWQSIYGLGYTGSEKAVEIVDVALKDNDARIRAVATRSMGVLGNAKYFDSIERMLVDEVAEVRWIAARMLGRLDASGSTDALLKSLNDANSQVRLEAAIALGYLKAQTAKLRLSELATKDTDPRVKEAASYAASLIE